jgi:predicted Fe-S protein YdhL (DUF1289 family)
MAKPARTVPPASPCISVCTLDDENRCLGCGRTLDEIARWGRMSATERWAVIDRLAAADATRGENR